MRIRAGVFGLGLLLAYVISCVGDDPTGEAPASDAGTDGTSSSTSSSSSGGQGDASNPNCVNGNGQCGAGCNALNDDDCKPICGNKVTEPGEVCDDGNTDNGDACDPTCQFTNKMSILSGKPESTYTQHTSADETGTFSRFVNPVALTTDGTNMFVLDKGDQTVKKVTAAGVVTTIAGHHGKTNSPGVDGTGAAATFDNPVGIAYVNGKLYVADYGTLRVVDLATNAVTTPNPANSPIYGSGNGASIRSGGTKILYVSSGGVYALDPANLTNAGVSTIASSSTIGTASGGVSAISVAYYPGFATTPYWIGTSRNIVRCPGGDAACTLHAGGTSTSGCVNGVNASARMTSVGGGATIGNGSFFFFDACNTIRFPNATVISPWAGSLTESGYVDGSGGQSGTARFNQITSMTGFGDALYVAEASLGQAAHGTIRKIFGSVTVTTFLGIPESSTNDFTPSLAGKDMRYPTFGSATDAVHPFIAMDDTYVYGVASASPSFVFRVSIATGGAEKLGVWDDGSQFLSPPFPSYGITLRGSDLYGAFGSDCTIWKIGKDGKSPAKYAGVKDSCSGPSAAGVDGAKDTATLNPRAITTDGTNIYFMDADRTLRVIDSADDMVKTLAGTGAAAAAVKDDIGTAARFGNTNAAMTYGAGSVYVADEYGSIIRRIELATKKVTTIAGKAGENGAVDGDGLTARFAGVTKMASDGKSLFLLDTANTGYPNANTSTVRQLDLATGKVSTMIGTRGVWTTKEGVGAAALVNMPDAVAFDPKGRLVIWDRNEGVFERIQ